MATTKKLKTSGKKLKNQMEITELKNIMEQINSVDIPSSRDERG